MTPLRIALIGCGKIADQHIDAIRRIPDATVVGTCDRELLMAQQLAERNGIPHFSSDVRTLLADARPDIVHITTPPEGHYSLALQCLDAGVHVYVEKPFTLTAAEASVVIERARARGRQVTAGHNLQHTWENVEARELIRQGFLGGPPVHIESHYNYSFGDAPYAKALLGDRQHWVRRLPGQLLHNIISHGIARIAEFLHTDDPQVVAFGHTSPLLRSIGETSIIDELRVHLSDRHNTTGYFVFSSQVSPPVNGVRIYGPVNSLIVDNVHHTLVRVRARNYKSYVNYFLPPVHQAFEYLRNSRRNIGRFLRADFHDDAGLKHCIEAFCRSVRNEGDPPASHREIVLTAVIMDRIFEQLSAQLASAAAPQVPPVEHVRV
ncbi:MAG TPA: Gfo/Idh/MocA family oxidoreductase [Vicinamibacterales bacterium]|nr:Gfo/Idh/MocA family oxidoreductase [Vicinamibacterales bacterium]